MKCDCFQITTCNFFKWAKFNLLSRFHFPKSIQYLAKQTFQISCHSHPHILGTDNYSSLMDTNLLPYWERKVFFSQFPGTLQFLSSLRRLWISVLETAPSSSTCWRDFNIKKRGHNFTSKDSAQWSERNSICIKSCH